jgi:hypothetical protein
MNAVKEKPTIRAERIELVGFDGQRVADAVIVIANREYPEIMMFNGDPFVPLLTSDGRPRNKVDDPLRYRQVRPYRLDIGG